MRCICLFWSISQLPGPCRSQTPTWDGLVMQQRVPLGGEAFGVRPQRPVWLHTHLGHISVQPSSAVAQALHLSWPESLSLVPSAGGRQGV